MSRRVTNWKWLSALAATVVTALAALLAFFPAVSKQPQAKEPRPAERVPISVAQSGSRVHVEVIQPTSGGMERTTRQPGSVISFESANLYAKISGYLQKQPVDIGSVVHRGDVLAVIDAPEFHKELEHAKAEQEQAVAQIEVAQARVLTAEADRDAAAAAVNQADAEIDRTTATRKFREKQYHRIKDLYALKSIDERLVDEKMDEMEAAQAAEQAAIAGKVTAKALLTAAGAKIKQAEADVANAKAFERVATSEIDKRQVYVDYTKIISPYDGVVTRRNFFPGDFIRAAEQGGESPLLSVERTDLMRVVVQVPDVDVPFVNPGDAAAITIDAQPGVAFSGAVSRVADAEDPETRTMRVEVDLKNDKHLLRQGMYGHVTITLDANIKNGVTVPSSAMVGDVNGGEGAVYVVRNGVAKLLKVRVGSDDGIHTEVLNGLTTADNVIVRHNAPIFDNTAVEMGASRK